MFCGYMSNGNFINNKKDNPTDLELYLGKDYDKIVKNTNFLETFFFGSLYLSYKKFFIEGFFFGLINMMFLYLGAVIGSYISIGSSNFPIPGGIFFLLIAKFLWMGYGNFIYIYLINKKIAYLKEHNFKKYQKVLHEEEKNSNFLLPFLTIFIYIIIIILVVIIYKSIK